MPKLTKPVDPTKPLKSGKQELFAQLVSIGVNGKPPVTQAEAYRIAYPVSRKWSDKTLVPEASRTASSRNVSARIEYLKQKSVEKTYISIERRKRILARVATEVGEVDPADHLEAGGDGVYINFGKESKNRGAIASITSKTDMSGEGGGAGAVITQIRYRPLTDAIQAIDTLNKMEGVYDAADNAKGKQPPVIFNFVFRNGPLVREPMKTITMDDARGATK